MLRIGFCWDCGAARPGMLMGGGAGGGCPAGSLLSARAHALRSGRYECERAACCVGHCDAPCAAGEGEAFCGQERLAVGPGSLVVFHPSAVHGIDVAPGGRRMYSLELMVSSFMPAHGGRCMWSAPC